MWEQTFFQTMGIPIVSGRSFGPQDTGTSQGRHHQPGAGKNDFATVNPIGKTFELGRNHAG